MFTPKQQLIVDEYEQAKAAIGKAYTSSNAYIMYERADTLLNLLIKTDLLGNKSIRMEKEELRKAIERFKPTESPNRDKVMLTYEICIQDLKEATEPEQAHTMAVKALHTLVIAFDLDLISREEKERLDHEAFMILNSCMFKLNTSKV